MGTKRLSRRGFLGRAAGASAALAGAATLAKPRKAMAANGKILMGIIGSGGRGCRLMKHCLDLDPMVEFVAVCDAYEPRQKAGLEIAGEKAKRFEDHRRLLEMKEIDAVVIATPDHTHAVITLACMKAGKHVYTQKPLTHDVGEARRLALAAKGSKLTTQMGIQIHSHSEYRTACALIQNGTIGKVKEVHTWSGKKWGDNAETLQGQRA